MYVVKWGCDALWRLNHCCGETVLLDLIFTDVEILDKLR